MCHLVSLISLNISDTYMKMLVLTKWVEWPIRCVRTRSAELFYLTRPTGSLAGELLFDLIRNLVHLPVDLIPVHPDVALFVCDLQQNYASSKSTSSCLPDTGRQEPGDPKRTQLPTPFSCYHQALPSSRSTYYQLLGGWGFGDVSQQLLQKGFCILLDVLHIRLSV